VFPQLLTFGLLNVGVAIVIEGALDFLGLGIPPPTPSWGGMIALGQQNLSSNPSLLLVPSAFLLVTVLALNRLGDALRAWWGIT
jgi:peptide/nickel transport system permease protein